MTADPAPAASSQTRAEQLAAIWCRGRPAVMGIVNCTPDSFSDGGRCLDPVVAAHHAQEMLSAGADLIDIGGESTRPGAEPVTADQECGRVRPVIRRLREMHPLSLISIDTTKPEVAAAGLAAGADIINDVTGGQQPAMLELAAAHDATIILMHIRGRPQTMQEDTTYSHVTAEVHAFLRRQAATAMAAGISKEKIWLDPGIGFGKDDTGNLSLLAALPELATMGHPVLIGVSRKSFIGRLTGAAVDNRLPGTLAALVPALGLPRVVVRVHEPGPVIQFLEIACRLQGAAA